jgi:hypothetical protein
VPRRFSRAFIGFDHILAEPKELHNRLERDEISLDRHPALALFQRLIFSENRFPLFGIML